MNKKIGSLLLAFALPLTSCNFNTCSAYDYQYYESGSFSYAQKRELEEEIKRLQHSVDNLEKEKLNICKKNFNIYKKVTKTKRILLFGLQQNVHSKIFSLLS